MARKRILTPTQQNLLDIITPLFNGGKPRTYEALKSLSEFKSFDGSFNALLDKGYLISFKDNDLNEFKLV